MCGIAGLFTLEEDPARRVQRLQGLLDGIRHRGPDDEGRWQGESLAIGMRRLSIIDLEGAPQPLKTEQGDLVLVFNGEIYNFRLLRTQLEERGERFTTRGDGEVILRGYRIWGERVLEKLEGMFAFALVDLPRRRLLLARDCFGVKPLYLLRQGRNLAFCSEPAPLLGLDEASRRLDHQGLAQYLAMKYVPAPRTLMQGLEKLPPATLVTISLIDGQVTRRCWWKPTSVPSRESPRHRLQVLLEAAVKRQMVSDVPLGVLLSGGIDSGLLLWAAGRAREMPLKGAFSVGFEQAGFDESTRAAVTARHLDVEHHVDRLPTPEVAELDGMVQRFGEPFANLSVPASFLLCRAAARHVKVALNGSGADELFGGYDRYFAVRPPALLRAVRPLAPLLRPLFDALPTGEAKRSVITRGRAFLRLADMPPGLAHVAGILLFDEEWRRRLAPDLPEPEPVVWERFRRAPVRDDLARACWADMTTMMADDYLTLVDRTSMAASLEVRVPFLDTELAGFALGLDPIWKIDGWRKKRILRELAAQVLPAEVAQGAKEGFEAPVGAWFRGDLGEAFIVAVKKAGLDGLLDVGTCEALLREHRIGRRDAAKQLLGLHTLALWMQRHGVTP